MMTSVAPLYVPEENTKSLNNVYVMYTFTCVCVSEF